MLCKPAGGVSDRLALFVTVPAAEPDTNLEIEDIADRVLLWCQANLGQHEVPSVVIEKQQHTIDSPQRLVEDLFNPSTAQAQADGLNNSFEQLVPTVRYPWELHSLLHSPGWSLVANPEEMDPNKENQIKIAGSLGEGDEALKGELHEYEVMVLKQAYQLFDPIDLSKETPYHEGWVTTHEFFVILKISQLYKPFDEPSHKNGSELHPTKSMLDENKGGYKLPGAYDLDDIDLHHQGSVTIDWPEFLMIVARLKATGKLELDTESGSPMANYRQP